MNAALIVSSVAVLISGLVFWVTVQQWRLAQHRFRLDLFDRRYRVYEATGKFVSSIFSKADFDDAQLVEFYRGTGDAEFLFDSDVINYLNEVKSRSLDMRMHHREFGRLVGSPEHAEHVKASLSQISWFGDQITEMKIKFIPYLGFAKIK